MNVEATPQEKKLPLSHKKKSGSETRQRGHRITFRLTDEEYAQAKAGADAAGLTVASHARLGVVRTPQTQTRRRAHADVAALSALHAQMRRVGGNLNQIARGVNSSEERAAADLPQALLELQQLMRRVRLDMGLEA